MAFCSLRALVPSTVTIEVWLIGTIAAIPAELTSMVQASTSKDQAIDAPKPLFQDRLLAPAPPISKESCSRRQKDSLPE